MREDVSARATEGQLKNNASKFWERKTLDALEIMNYDVRESEVRMFIADDEMLEFAECLVSFSMKREQIRRAGFKVVTEHPAIISVMRSVMKAWSFLERQFVLRHAPYIVRDEQRMRLMYEMEQIEAFGNVLVLGGYNLL